MKIIFLFCLFLSFTPTLSAQKKLTPVQQSALTGIGLPAGSKKDGRMLSVAGAKMLLEMESDKANVKISSMEVLVLPAATAGGYNSDSLAKSLSGEGWEISVVKEDKKYAWLKKSNRNLIMYFSANAKESGLYFAEAGSAPVAGVAGKDSGNIQATSTQVSQVSPTSASTTTTTTETVTQTDPPKIIQSAATNTGYAFTTTNFDDGWVGNIYEDWVQVTKGDMKVLLHYPKEGTIIPADPEPLVNNAWNILVAPRYSNLKNYKTSYISTFDRPYLGMGEATDIATGKNVFLVLFRQGQTGWIEFVASDKNAFIREFKFDPYTIQWDSNTDLMIPLANMVFHNKFGVAASDLRGKWSSDFTGIMQLYNVYTGQYAGMNIHQSNEEFVFSGDSYSWKLVAVNGIVGNIDAVQVKSDGQFTVPNNWQIHFSKIEGKPHTYHAFWSCIKGARVLNLLDADAPGNGMYTKYGMAK